MKSKFSTNSLTPFLVSLCRLFRVKESSLLWAVGMAKSSAIPSKLKKSLVARVFQVLTLRALVTNLHNISQFAIQTLVVPFSECALLRPCLPSSRRQILCMAPNSKSRLTNSQVLSLSLILILLSRCGIQTTLKVSRLRLENMVLQWKTSILSMSITKYFLYLQDGMHSSSSGCSMDNKPIRLDRLTLASLSTSSQPSILWWWLPTLISRSMFGTYPKWPKISSIPSIWPSRHSERLPLPFRFLPQLKVTALALLRAELELLG